MIYRDYHNVIYRIPFISERLRGLPFKLKEIILNVSIQALKDSLTFNLAPINLLNGEKSIFETIGSVSENYSFPIKVQRSESFLSFYFFMLQILEIKEFQTVYRNPTSPNHPETIIFQNRGENDILIESVKTETSDFVITNIPTNKTLSPGNSLRFDLSFTPKKYGFFTDLLQIKTNLHSHHSITIPLFGTRKTSSSYYRTINGVRYDRMLLEIAYSLMKQNPSQIIDVYEIKIIANCVWDAGRITSTEKRSLKYLWDNYQWSDNAKNWFRKGYSWIGI